VPRENRGAGYVQHAHALIFVLSRFSRLLIGYVWLKPEPVGMTKAVAPDLAFVALGPQTAAPLV
jgi:hypothetical protein